MFFTYFSYFLVASYLFEGKTIGKSIFNLRVVNKLERDGQIFFRDCLLRSVGYTLCYIMLFIPFLASAFGKEAKGLPDYLSETEVVTEEDFQQLLRDQEESQTLNKTEDRAINQLDLFAS